MVQHETKETSERLEISVENGPKISRGYKIFEKYEIFIPGVGHAITHTEKNQTTDQIIVFYPTAFIDLFLAQEARVIKTSGKCLYKIRQRFDYYSA